MINLQKIKQEKKLRRKARVRAKVFGTEKRPRLHVARSIKHVFVQLIDDTKGRTIVGVSDAVLGKKKVGKRKRVVAALSRKSGERSGKVAIAFEVGKLIAAKAKEMGVKSVVFDRGGFKYHGRVKAVAEGAREGGLEF